MSGEHQHELFDAQAAHQRLVTKQGLAALPGVGLEYFNRKGAKLICHEWAKLTSGAVQPEVLRDWIAHLNELVFVLCDGNPWQPYALEDLEFLEQILTHRMMMDRQMSLV